MIRAKFICNSVTWYQFGEEAQLSAVYSIDPEHINNAWSKGTPSGQLSLLITNSLAEGQFVPGKEYYLDITPAGE